MKRRFPLPRRSRPGKYTKPTVGLSALWSFLPVCRAVRVYGFASDAFTFGDMGAHRFSLATQTLLKIIARRIERLADASGNNTLVYHLDGLEPYFRESGLSRPACEDILNSSPRGTLLLLLFHLLASHS